ncbi:MAG: hypothetical protein KUG56_08005, partial [Kordiimonadaceae bacterium]|nr:hypothetical protein [Kordiimonadaceae bacterium]
TDVLESLFENSSFSLERFIAYLQKSGAKVILVERSSVMAQATMGQLLHQTAERSIWTKKPSKKVHIKADGADFLKSWDQRKTILRGVSILDKVEQASVDTMRVTLEEFADHQARHMKDIASFLSVDMGEEVVELAYASKFGMAPDIYPMAAQFQRELIDRLGLHIDLPE